MGWLGHPLLLAAHHYSSCIMQAVRAGWTWVKQSAATHIPGCSLKKLVNALNNCPQSDEWSILATMHWTVMECFRMFCLLAFRTLFLFVKRPFIQWNERTPAVALDVVHAGSNEEARRKPGVERPTATDVTNARWGINSPSVPGMSNRLFKLLFFSLSLGPHALFTPLRWKSTDVSPGRRTTHRCSVTVLISQEQV